MSNLNISVKDIALSLAGRGVINHATTTKEFVEILRLAWLEAPIGGKAEPVLEALKVALESQLQGFEQNKTIYEVIKNG